MRRSILTLVVLLLASAGTTHALEVTRARIDALKEKHRSGAASVDERLELAAMLRTIFAFGEAMTVAQEVTQETPDDPRPWLELAWIELRSGQRGPAQVHAQKAASLGDTGGVAERLIETLSAADRFRAKTPLAGPETAAIRKRLEELGVTASPLRGVRWVALETADGTEAGSQRVRLWWEVVPADMDPTEARALPDAWKELLPIAWLLGLDAVGDPDLQATALGRARETRWYEVTTADARVGGDGGVEIRVNGRPLAPAGVAAATDAPAAASPALTEQDLKREMFKNRYGKSEPAKGDPYAWRQMAFGGVIVVLAGLFLFWLIRREKAKGPRPSR